MNEKRVTIYDIAKKAGVSVATVTRAFGNTGRISAQTKQRILAIAKEFGYTANAAAQSLHRAPIELGAILFCQIDEYVDAIIDGMQHTSSSLEKYRVRTDIRKIPFTTSKECLEQTQRYLCEFENLGYKGVILFLSSMLNELDEISVIIERLVEKGVVVATVANDLFHTKRTLHVGVDAEMAGKCAAELLEMTCSNTTVALLIASKLSSINMHYVSGFQQRGNAFSKIVIYEHFDEKEKIALAMQQMLSENSDLRGVYMATASSTMACQYIPKGSHLSVITTDLLSETPKLLSDKISNAVIFQNPYKQGKNVVRAVYDHIVGKPQKPKQLILPQILLSSNAKAYMAKQLNEKD